MWRKRCGRSGRLRLSGFSGVTLSKIKSITIGFGPGAGTGTIFIDDMQLGRKSTATSENGWQPQADSAGRLPPGAATSLCLTR